MSNLTTKIRTEIAQNLPKLMGKPMQIIPNVVQHHLVTKVLQRVFEESLNAGELNFLEGLYIKFEIEDCNLNWVFTFNGQAIRIVSNNQADVSIRCNMREFILLANQRIDPDTLFFQRRLIIEGNTELGLTMKNLLDTIDSENLPFLLVKGLQVTEYLLTPDLSHENN